MGPGLWEEAAQLPKIQTLPRRVVAFLATAGKASGHWAWKPDPDADGLLLAQEALWRSDQRNLAPQLLEALSRGCLPEGHLLLLQLLAFHSQVNSGPFHKYSTPHPTRWAKSQLSPIGSAVSMDEN